VIFSNPKAYLERSKPRSRDDLNDSVAEFFKGVYDLATKHGIADVSFITHCIAETDEGPESLYAPCHIGNESLAPEMADYLWSYMRTNWDRRLDEIKAQAAKVAKKETA
jgi:hypothetical protein